MWDELAFSTGLTGGGPGLPKLKDLVATYTETGAGSAHAEERLPRAGLREPH